MISVYADVISCTFTFLLHPHPSLILTDDLSMYFTRIIMKTYQHVHASLLRAVPAFHSENHTVIDEKIRKTVSWQNLVNVIKQAMN